MVFVPAILNMRKAARINPIGNSLIEHPSPYSRNPSRLCSGAQGVLPIHDLVAIGYVPVFHAHTSFSHSVIFTPAGRITVCFIGADLGSINDIP